MQNNKRTCYELKTRKMQRFCRRNINTLNVDFTLYLITETFDYPDISSGFRHLEEVFLIFGIRLKILFDLSFRLPLASASGKRLKI